MAFEALVECDGCGRVGRWPEWSDGRFVCRSCYEEANN